MRNKSQIQSTNAGNTPENWQLKTGNWQLLLATRFLPMANSRQPTAQADG